MADERNHPADTVDEPYDEPYDQQVRHDSAEGTHGASSWRADNETIHGAGSPDRRRDDAGATAHVDADADARTDSRTDTWDASDDTLYRSSEDAPGGASAAGSATAATASRSTSHESVVAERERLQAERNARREARLAALAPAPQPDPAAAAAPRATAATSGASLSPIPSEPVVTERVVTRRNTDRFGPSLGLFVLRLVTAAIMGVHGIQKLLNLPGTTAMIEQTVIPYPSIMAIVVGAAEVAIAIALVFGLMTRVAGLGVLLVAGGALAFVLWGNWNPFVPGQSGFTGELELLLAAVGLLLLFTGGGGWAVDRGFRARRAAERELREA